MKKTKISFAVVAMAIATLNSYGQTGLWNPSGSGGALTTTPADCAIGGRLSVGDQIGLMPSATSLGVVKINGNIGGGAMLMQSNTSQTDGPSIALHGFPGNYMIRYISPNNNPFTGHIFQSYDG